MNIIWCPKCKEKEIWQEVDTIDVDYYLCPECYKTFNLGEESLCKKN